MNIFHSAPSWMGGLENSVGVVTLTVAVGCLIVVWYFARSRLKAFLIKIRNVFEKPSPIQKTFHVTLSRNVQQKTCRPSGFIKNVKVFYGTQTGNAKKLSKELVETLQDKGWTVELINLKDYDPDDSFLEEAKKKTTCIFIISTYVDGHPPDDAKWFCKWLKDICFDFRMQKFILNGMKYGVFGLGNSLYGENFNKVSKELDEWLNKLEAERIMDVGLGDENMAESKNGDIHLDFVEWKKRLIEILEKPERGYSSQQIKADRNKEMLYESSDDDVEDVGSDGSELVDVEDLGSVMNKMKNIKVAKKKILEDSGPKEMITPTLRKALTKQGYKLIGSHSGVKLCRWTKSMLRGRGGCYKHTFYGIESHRCVEATPSLACANKCVFCWRHHSNPVGTEWKWKMDNPELIFQEALKNHYRMIKEFKGVPGVKEERFKEGMEAKHCALSLVGEPIMYPEINKFVRLLHGRGISTFLVTNAQFPDAISKLDPVTQLYVSVDAASKDSLKKIDRPLFRDFWTRFLDSLKALSDKGQRTVYRLTLVKAWNTEEIEGYAKLIELGRPDFIEIKFKINGEWRTWIDYEKFHKLIRRYYESNGEETFTSLDYMLHTPNWAIIGAKERGFDPVETRFLRKSKKDISGC
ncbi:S-adenosyl-L-methionine-dependent tRNA 4-demethylwyosine synthase-like isoform X2 [Centruroides sculpturatus]|uniref:S-adenosyl-L-methionine-dependent tRNA 4-demethylwyosine synthase-like isoform X2 n=1 Tax=Centruroides sculpturatus TaxID=218467 RepID=UPI000C6C9C43|nr:S-adenosyl-L-methionine-dependent tRNA 4-demethylwyosine synthase-like isoform X2 [Centruroides sculpturatus]